MTVVHHTDRETLLAHEIDDLLLQARGLVLVRDLLDDRGATRAEIDAHNAELARVRAYLADLIRGAGERDYGEAA
jgi:phosphatidylserine/phosphatidylglycerophosphate/cardiolipin synthase-like enzyme